MSSYSFVQTRLAEIFREKERYLEEKRRCAEAADDARRSHAETFLDVVVRAALPAFETIGAGLAAYGLEHRIKRSGLLDGNEYEAEQQVTFEFRVADDAASSGPLLGRAFLRLSTDVGSRTIRLHSEIAGGPDTPFAGSSSDTREVELGDLNASFFEAAALDLVERAVQSTYLDPDDTPGQERPRSESAGQQAALRRTPAQDDGARGESHRDDAARVDSRPGDTALGRASRDRASQGGASGERGSRDGASPSSSTSASTIGT